MAQEFRPGEIVPQSGIYTITHDPAHADMPLALIDERKANRICAERFPSVNTPARRYDALAGTRTGRQRA